MDINEKIDMLNENFNNSDMTFDEYSNSLFELCLEKAVLNDLMIFIEEQLEAN